MSEVNKKEINIFINSITDAGESKSFLYKNLIPLVLSKKIFKNSNELKKFIKDILDLELHDYVYRSRTILIGKITRHINSLSLEDVIKLNQLVENFLIDLVKSLKGSEEQKNELKNKKSAFARWNEYISKQ